LKQNRTNIAVMLAAGLLAVLLLAGCGEAEAVQELVTTQVESIAVQAETEPLPQEIEGLIAEAQDYYAQGLYGDASKAYRNAILALERLDREDTQALLDDLNVRYEQTRKIVDSARMHHGNAMQLQYETRFEEAINELKRALEIYPKYQPAIDALKTLEALEELQ